MHWMRAGATASLYVPAVLLCPPLLPIVRFLAGIWPDAGMRTVRFFPALRRLDLLLTPDRTCHAAAAAAAPHGACNRGAGQWMLSKQSIYRAPPGRLCTVPNAVLGHSRLCDAVLRCVVQAVAARATLVRTCANLLRKVREADGAQLPNGVPSAGPPKRGVLPGSFLHHLARARHHPTFREGALLTDAEVISQVGRRLLPCCSRCSPRLLVLLPRRAVKWLYNMLLMTVHSLTQCWWAAFADISACLLSCRHSRSCSAATRPRRLPWASRSTTCPQTPTRLPSSQR